MLLTDLLTPETVRIALPGDSKQEVLREIIDLLKGHPAVRDLDAVRESVLQREKSMSTGVGKELALPHGKSAGVTETVAALAVTDRPVDFAAIDGHPVRIVFLLVGAPEAKSQHVKILSRISRIMNREALRESLLGAESDAQLLAALAEGERALMEH